MLTYQMQPRCCRIEGDNKLVFPNDVEIAITLDPSGQFGVGKNLGRYIVAPGQEQTHFDRATGRISIINRNNFLEPIKAALSLKNLNMTMDGNTLTIKTNCKCYPEFNNLLNSLHFLGPVILGVKFLHPPVVTRTHGMVGSAKFNYLLIESTRDLYATRKEHQEELVSTSMKYFPTVISPSNARLTAALYYFYISKRLEEAGHTPYEFYSEYILNLAKSLQILFGHDNDDIRGELAKLGYSVKEIKEDFITVMFLRNEFDVGHASLSYYPQEKLVVLYKYLFACQSIFSEMFSRVLDKLEDGSYQLKEYKQKVDKKKTKLLDGLIENIEKGIERRSTG